MAPPKQNMNSNKFPKSKKKKKKNKSKSKIASSVPVDSKAIDSEWWDVFLKKNSSSHGTFQFLLHFRPIFQVLFDRNPAVKFKLVSWIPVLIICSYPFLDLKDTFLGTSFGKLGNSNFDVDPNVPHDEEELFKYFFRLSKKAFEYICTLVREDLVSRPPSGLINIEGRLLSVEKQAAIALRRLASGESQVSVGASFGVGQSTVSQVTWRFIEAMEDRARHHLRWPDSSKMERIKSGFESSSGLPNCCGAIDATHIVMTLPAVQTSDDWCDQENNYSMFVQGVIDSEMRFLDIVTGWPGGMPVSRLLKCSGFYKLCESGARLNGNVKVLSDGEEVREYVVGGASYPLLPWLVTPYKDDEHSGSGSEFNLSLETARSAAAKAFSQLKGGWRILNKVMWRPDKKKLPSIILVCSLLHNIIIDCGDRLNPDVSLSGYHDSDYMGQICKQVNPLGITIRENLAKHLRGRKQNVAQPFVDVATS